MQVAEGFNFLLHVGGGKAELLVASNYNPVVLFNAGGAANRMTLGMRRKWNPALENWSPFEPIEVEPNRWRPY